MENNNKKLTPEQARAATKIVHGLQEATINNLCVALNVSRETLYKAVRQVEKEEESK